MSTALARIDSTKFESALSRFKAEAQLITLDSPEKCLQAKTMQRDVRNYIKDAKAALDPFVNMAKRTYDDARDERSRWVDPAQMIDDALAAKVKEFERKERDKAMREEEERNRVKREAEAREAEYQRKIREAQALEERKARQKEIDEARKAGDLNKREAERMKKQAEEEERQKREQAAKDAEATKANFVPDRVLPQIPTVSGVPSRRNYRFEITAIEKIPRYLLYPNKGTDGKYDPAKFPAIGEKVRDDKNPAKSMAEIPGIRAFED